MHLLSLNCGDKNRMVSRACLPLHARMKMKQEQQILPRVCRANSCQFSDSRTLENEEFIMKSNNKNSNPVCLLK